MNQKADLKTEDMLTIFSQNLKNYCHFSGITQNLLAERIHVASSTVSKFINQDSLPSTDSLYKISMEIGVPMNDLISRVCITGIDPPAVSASAPLTGSYYCYYLNPTLTPDSMLSYGIVKLFRTADGQQNCFCVLGLKSEQEAIQLLERSGVIEKQPLDLERAVRKLENFRESDYLAKYGITSLYYIYSGKYSFNSSFIYLQVRDILGDCALFALPNPFNNQAPSHYFGGVGTALMSTKGNRPLQTAERIGLSASPIEKAIAGDPDCLYNVTNLRHILGSELSPKIVSFREEAIYTADNRWWKMLDDLKLTRL